MQASGRSSLTSPSAAKQGAADEISLEVEGLDGATDLASEAHSPVRGEPQEQHCSRCLWAAHLLRGLNFSLLEGWQRWRWCSWLCPAGSQA